MSKKTADDFVEIDKSNYKEYVFVKSPKSSHWKNKRARIGNSRCACSDFYRYRYLRQAGQIRRGGQHNSDYGIFQRGGCACA